MDKKIRDILGDFQIQIEKIHDKWVSGELSFSKGDLCNQEISQALKEIEKILSELKTNFCICGNSAVDGGHTPECMTRRDQVNEDYKTNLKKLFE